MVNIQVFCYLHFSLLRDQMKLHKQLGFLMNQHLFLLRNKLHVIEFLLIKLPLKLQQYMNFLFQIQNYYFFCFLLLNNLFLIQNKLIFTSFSLIISMKSLLIPLVYFIKSLKNFYSLFYYYFLYYIKHYLYIYYLNLIYQGLEIAYFNGFTIKLFHI